MPKSRRNGSRNREPTGEPWCGHTWPAPQGWRRNSSLLSRRRLWILRIVVAFAAPAVFLLLLELALGLCRAGYPTSFFVGSERRGNLTTNIRFGWHYQQETLAEPSRV